jgi:hypothetical protein
MEGERNREKYDQRKDIPRETVRVVKSFVQMHWPLTFSRRQRYNDDISLEDAIHTALLTLKEGFEGQMTEKTIEIGVVTVPTIEELEEGKIGGVTGRVKPTFRKLTEEEVRDYLAL